MAARSSSTPEAGPGSRFTRGATAAGSSPKEGLILFGRLTSDPTRTYPVDVIQMGLGALQQAREETDWLRVVGEVVRWIRYA